VVKNLKKVYSLSLLIMLALCAAISAADPKPPTPPAKDSAPDTRLDQKVTYQAKGKCLYKVLAELTEKTGVVMRCGRNEHDWQSRDRKVTIFVKDMPLKELQQALADVLRFKWSRTAGTDGVYMYRLRQDLKGAQEEEALRKKHEEEKTRKIVENRQSAMSAIENLENLTPADLEKLKSESPMLYILATEPFGQGLSRMVRSLPPAAKALVSAAGSPMSMPLSSAPAGLVEGAKTMVTGLDSLAKSFGGSGNIFSGVVENIQQGTLTFRPPDSLFHSIDAFSSMLGTIEINVPGQPQVMVPLFDPKSPAGNLIGKALMRMQMGMSPEQIEPLMQADMAKALAEQNGGEKIVYPDDPALDTEVKLDITAPLTLPDLIEKLAKKTDFQYISDHFSHSPIKPNPTEGKLSEVLKGIAILYQKNISKKGSLMLFEDREWYVKRAWEVPESLLEKWRTAVKENTITFYDILDMASLSDDQIMHTLRTEESLQSVGWQLFSSAPVLRLYSALSETQRAALTSDAGLDLHTLTPEQTSYLDALLSRIRRQTPSEDTHLTLFMTEETKSGPWTFKLTTLNTDDEHESEPQTLQTWTIRLPEKQEPTVKKEESKPNSSK